MEDFGSDDAQAYAGYWPGEDVSFEQATAFGPQAESPAVALLPQSSAFPLQPVERPELAPLPAPFVPPHERTAAPPAPAAYGAALAPQPSAAGLWLKLLLVAGAAGGAGYYADALGGSPAFGAGAGSLAGGALINFVRAWKAYRLGTPDGDREAAISGTFALAAAGGAAYLWWRFVVSTQDGSVRANPDDDEPALRPRGGCSIRRVGP